MNERTERAEATIHVESNLLFDLWKASPFPEMHTKHHEDAALGGLIPIGIDQCIPGSHHGMV
jgi:hypothetical protein